MNERIRELAEQAKFAMNVSNDPNSPPSWWAAGHNDTFEKFALLIVQECADVAKETRWAVPPSQEQIARGIQQHFGVEE